MLCILLDQPATQNKQGTPVQWSTSTPPITAITSDVRQTDVIQAGDSPYNWPPLPPTLAAFTYLIVVGAVPFHAVWRTKNKNKKEQREREKREPVKRQTEDVSQNGYTLANTKPASGFAHGDTYICKKRQRISGSSDFTVRATSPGRYRNSRNRPTCTWRGASRSKTDHLCRNGLSQCLSSKVSTSWCFAYRRDPCIDGGCK